MKPVAVPNVMPSRFGVINNDMCDCFEILNDMDVQVLAFSMLLYSQSSRQCCVIEIGVSLEMTAL